MSFFSPTGTSPKSITFFVSTEIRQRDVHLLAVEVDVARRDGNAIGMSAIGIDQFCANAEM